MNVVITCYVRKCVLLCVVVASSLFCNTSFAQGLTADNIKRMSDVYLYGEASGRTRKQADDEALSVLIGKISVSVESEFSWLANEEIKNGNSMQSEEICKSLVNTYSSATLTNTESMEWGETPNVTVFRYVKRSEVSKVFEQRKNKILDYTKIAREAERDNNIADALRYYYWSLVLLRSHPDGNDIYYTEEEYESAAKSERVLLYSYIPLQINNILNKLKISVVDSQETGNLTRYNLNISYNGRDVSSCDYTYSDTNGWSNLMGAKDGLGVVELVGDVSLFDKVDVRVEYQFEDKMNIDPEVEGIFNMAAVNPPVFKNNRYTVSLKAKDISKQKKRSVETNSGISQLSTNTLDLAPNVDTSNHISIIERVTAAINGGDYSAVASDFTTEGYNVYNKLIRYGNAKCLVEEPDYHFLECNGSLICRAVPMRFKFNNNNRVFIENVVFHFNAESKIENVTFALDSNTFNEVFDSKQWDAYVSWIIVDFMENYQTAYALERIDYLNSIFDDNALIIVGSVLKNVKATDTALSFNNDIVKRTRYTKAQYISNLGNVFRQNEYINIKLVNISIKKAPRGDNLFGIQVCQDYYSTNYGDKGYLFLLVDLADKSKPNILVRTWQEEPDPEYGVVDLSHF